MFLMLRRLMVYFSVINLNEIIIYVVLWRVSNINTEQWDIRKQYARSFMKPEGSSYVGDMTHCRQPHDFTVQLDVTVTRDRCFYFCQWRTRGVVCPLHYYSNTIAFITNAVKSMFPQRNVNKVCGCATDWSGSDMFFFSQNTHAHWPMSFVWLLADF